MKVFAIQQLCLQLIHPLGLFGKLALGAVLVSARIVGLSLVIAAVTVAGVSVKFTCSACADIPKSLSLLFKQVIGIQVLLIFS
jgi:hypothetical protein